MGVCMQHLMLALSQAAKCCFAAGAAAATDKRLIMMQRNFPSPGIVYDDDHQRWLLLFLT